MAGQTTGAPTVEKTAENAAATANPHHAATEATEAASGGLPQFEFQHWGGQIAYMLILFVALYVLMSRVFIPRVRKIFDERERTISEALTSARSVQSEAAAQAEAARKALADARATAQKTAADAKSAAQADAKARQSVLEAELSAKLNEAEGRIRTARDAAMTHVSAVASETAQAIIEKLTGAPASGEQVSAALAKLQG